MKASVSRWGLLLLFAAMPCLAQTQDTASSATSSAKPADASSTGAATVPKPASTEKKKPKKVWTNDEMGSVSGGISVVGGGSPVNAERGKRQSHRWHQSKSGIQHGAGGRSGEAIRRQEETIAGKDRRRGGRSAQERNRTRGVALTTRQPPNTRLTQAESHGVEGGRRWEESGINSPEALESLRLHEAHSPSRHCSFRQSNSQRATSFGTSATQKFLQ
jgi:hypothetical protein